MTRTRWRTNWSCTMSTSSDSKERARNIRPFSCAFRVHFYLTKQVHTTQNKGRAPKIRERHSLARVRKNPKPLEQNGFGFGAADGSRTRVFFCLIHCGAIDYFSSCAFSCAFLSDDFPSATPEKYVSSSTPAAFLSSAKTC